MQGLQRVFAPMPVQGQDKEGGHSPVSLLRDLLWDEIDVHSPVCLRLLGVEMRLGDGDEDDHDNPALIQMAKAVRLLLSIPLHIEEDKVWSRLYMQTVSDARGDGSWRGKEGSGTELSWR